MDRKIAELIKEGRAQWAAIEMAAPERTEPNFPLSSHVPPAQLYDLGERASMMAEAAGLVKEALSNWEEASQQSEAIRQQFAAEMHMKNVYAHLFERAKARAAAAPLAPAEDGGVVNTSSHAGLLEVGHSDPDQHSEVVRYPDSDRPAPSESTSDSDPPHYALRRELLHSLVTELSTTPLRLPPGMSIDDARVSVGAPGSERRIVNVARGTHSTDAVNKAQLDEAVARVDGDASAGIASAMAVAGLPQPTAAGRSIATASSASYRGRAGMAFGVSHVTSDDRWVIKLAASANGRSYFGAVAAGGFQW
ncbi:YadA family autotransporter adhesin [Mycetohabitans sp. B46]|uniref:YadA family autotransporter adhesin n=1 Tax=Mycetohabitans sp. B46 TaxID=2772536 RepID=UPI00307F2653